MDRRFQVFVSSTFEDLQPERQEVMHALLELDCIPSGMELFPAANEDQWTLIRKVIDECDYYIVIVAGRYGSVGSEGQSYTEMEYRHAVDTGKPIISFLHKDPASLPARLTEQESERRGKLGSFRALCQTRVCKYWTSAAELGSIVSRSVVQLIKTHPAVGWVRADLVPDESAAAEIVRLRRQVDSLQADLAKAATTPPPGSEMFAQGDDQFKMNYYYTMSGGVSVTTFLDLSWNEMFGVISPLLIDEATESEMKGALGSLALERDARQAIALNVEFEDRRLLAIRPTDSAFDTIKIQLRALGLIAKSPKQHSLRDSSTYWTLTPFGDSVMTQLRAVRR